MKKTYAVLAAMLLSITALFANPQILTQEIKRNGNVILTMTSDVSFELVATSDFINYTVMATYKAKNHVIFIDPKRQKNQPYFFYFVRPIRK